MRDKESFLSKKELIKIILASLGIAALVVTPFALYMGVAVPHMESEIARAEELHYVSGEVVDKEHYMTSWGIYNRRIREKYTLDIKWLGDDSEMHTSTIFVDEDYYDSYQVGDEYPREGEINKAWER